MSLTQLAARLPSVALARLLLALMLICNLTLCISWHGASLATASASLSLFTPQTLPDDMSSSHGDDAGPRTMVLDQENASVTLSCHASAGSESTMTGDECQMQTGLSGAANALPLLGMLLSALLLPLLLLPLGTLPRLLDLWLRDPFLRTRGTHPPSWPRRHLMLSVLRH
ncbi:hypothetical protein [Aeromonas enteropelogenes]|uniref:hypothetical protein n=1 Tax=Aeromonas enteropelogenes TaxID=29489 RepID=UPI003BA340EA